MRLRTHVSAAVMAAIASLAMPTPASAASSPRLGARCAAGQWGELLGSYVCVRIGKSAYVLGQFPAEAPITSTAPAAAKPPKLGGKCKPTQYGRALGPYICTRTGRATYLAALLFTPPPLPLPLAAITPSSATPQIETTLPAPPTKAPVESTTVVPAVTSPPTPPSTSSPPATPSARRFANCTELNAVYPHGVARTGGADQTSGKPVTTYTVDDAVYEVNKGSDRDGDGVACEKA